MGNYDKVSQQATKAMTKQKWYVNIKKAKAGFALEASSIEGYFTAIYKWCVVREYHNSNEYQPYNRYWLGSTQLDPDVVDKLIKQNKLVKEKTVDVVYDDF